MRKGRDGEWKMEKMEKMENNGENSGPLTSLPVDRPTATDCNAAARANIAILSCLEGNAIPEPICHGCALKILLLSLALREGQGQLRKHAGEEFDNNLELFNWLRHRQLPLIDPKRHLYLGYCSKYQNHLRH